MDIKRALSAFCRISGKGPSPRLWMGNGVFIGPGTVLFNRNVLGRLEFQDGKYISEVKQVVVMNEKGEWTLIDDWIASLRCDLALGYLKDDIAPEICQPVSWHDLSSVFSSQAYLVTRFKGEFSIHRVTYSRWANRFPYEDDYCNTKFEISGSIEDRDYSGSPIIKGGRVISIVTNFKKADEGEMKKTVYGPSPRAVIDFTETYPEAPLD